MLRALAKDSAIYAAADLLVKSTQLILTPYYLTRLSVEEFGHLGIIVAVLALGASIFNLGFQSGLIRFYHLASDQRGDLLPSTWFFLTLLAIPVSPAFAWIVHTSGVFSGAALDFRYILLLVLTSAEFGIVLNNGIAVLKVRQEPIKSGILGFLSSATTLITIIILVETDQFSNLEGIVLGQFIGMSLGSLLTVIALGPLLLGRPNKTLFKEMLRYSNPLVLHNVLQWALNSADRFILVRILGAEALGGYFFAYQFGTGLKLLGRSLNSSVLHIYSESAADPNRVGRARLVSTAFLWTVVGLFCLIGILAPIVIGATHWDKFDDYLYIVPMVTAGAAIYLLYYLPMNVLSLTLGRSRGIYGLTAIAAMVSVALNVLLVGRGVFYAGLVNLISFNVLSFGFLLTVSRLPTGREYLPIASTARAMVAMAVLGLAGALMFA